MKLFIIIILLIHCINSFGDNFGAKITKTQLRGMRKEYLEGLIKEKFVKTFDSLYDKIIQRATLGKNEYHFTFNCLEETRKNNMLRNKNGHSEPIHNLGSQEKPDNIIALDGIFTPFNTIEQFKTNVINALKQTFLDSNITKINTNYCDYYSIEW
jgi:hypothetical protein